jgi:hypothetical protein
LIWIVTTLGLLWPVVRNRDSFPLSTYPMYASARSNTATFVFARGVDDQGEGITLGMQVQAATRDPLIAEAALRSLRRAPVDVRVTACERIMRRASGQVMAVEIVEQNIDIRIGAGRGVLSEKVLVRCGA